MNSFEKWLLRKLIRTSFRSFQERLVVEYLWDESKRRYYEDNLPTRYDHIERMVLVEYDKDVEECRKLSST